MDSFIYSLNATVPIFLVMIVGWIIKRLGVIDDHFVNVANKYVFRVALPVLVFKDLAAADFKSQFDVKFVLYCMIVTTIMFSVIWILTEIFMKDDTEKGAFVQASFRSSAAILGMAFIQNMYQSTGMAPLMIVAAVPLFNIFSVIVLTFKAHPECHGKAVSDSVDKKENIKKACVNIATNPIIIGILLGLVSSLIGINYPPIISKTVMNIAQTATPVALICIGAGFEGRKAVKKVKPTVIATFIKLVLLAAIFLPVAVRMGFRNQELMAILIMLASPSTVTCYVMAKGMDNDDVLSSSIVVLTTLLSSITLTAWIFILRNFGFI
ncbi:MAG: AEC family transporter [Clostridia bacterium]|nr:AEC family transporter [Clostridia bacterium]